MGITLLTLSFVLLVVGGLWLLAIAFGEGPLIGLGTLLIPFFALYTLFRCWPSSKIPAILLAGGLTLGLLSIPLAPEIPSPSFAREPEVTWSEKNQVRGGPVTNPGAEARPPAAEPEAVAADESATEAKPGTDRTPSTSRSPAAFQRPGGRGGESVPAERVGDYVGRYVTVERADGERIQGTIEKVDGQTVLLRRRIGGGTISFKLERSDIRQLFVTRRID